MSDHNADDPELIERIRNGLDRAPVRELPSPTQAKERGRRRRRIAFVRTSVLAVLLAVAVIVPLVQLSGLRGNSGPGPAPATQIPEPKANGDIWAQLGGAEVGTAIERVDPITGSASILWTDGGWPQGSTRTLADHVNQAAVGNDYSFSPDGSEVVFSHYPTGAPTRTMGTELFVMDANGTNVRQLTHDHAVDGFPAWSPDGRSITYAGYRGGNFIPGCLGTTICPPDLYVVDATGGTPTQLTSDPFGETTPSWSPDGSRIVFASVRSDGTGTLEVMNADGAARTAITSGSGAYLSFPRWSPDGATIAFLREDQGHTMHLWTVALDGSSPRDLLETQADTTFGNPVWSPDGMQIAFARLSSVGPQLWLTDLTGSAHRLATGQAGYGLSPIAWQPAVAGSRASQAPSLASTSNATSPGSISLFRGRTNDHFWRLSATKVGSAWDLELVAKGGGLLAGTSGLLESTHPALTGSYTWQDAGGPVFVAFGLATTRIHALLVTAQTNKGRQTFAVAEPLHNSGLPDGMVFYLQDFNGAPTSIRGVRNVPPGIPQR